MTLEENPQSQIDKKRKGMNHSSLKYYYKNQEDLLRKKREQYNKLKEFNRIAKQLMNVYAIYDI